MLSIGRQGLIYCITEILCAGALSLALSGSPCPFLGGAAFADNANDNSTISFIEKVEDAIIENARAILQQVRSYSVSDVKDLCDDGAKNASAFLQRLGDELGIEDINSTDIDLPVFEGYNGHVPKLEGTWPGTS